MFLPTPQNSISHNISVNLSAFAGVFLLVPHRIPYRIPYLSFDLHRLEAIHHLSDNSHVQPLEKCQLKHQDFVRVVSQLHP